MKTMKYFLSMAALALVGAMTVSCSSDDNIIEQPQQPETKNNVVTLTTTVSLDGGDATRALSSTGVKTFAADETMALIYKNKSGNTVKAVSEPLPAGDYGKSATFTFTLENPDKDQDVTYIYPAAMAGATDVDWNKLNTQNGTLSTLSSNLDLATSSAAWNGNNLPAVTLANQLAILAVTLKNEAGTSDITNTITSMVVIDGANDYTVNRTAAAGPIYVAIQPTSSATIDVIATDGTKNYTKTLTSKAYAASNGYNVSWKMAEAPFRDLSILDCAGNLRPRSWTANCYMVHTAGDYKLPLVYGNAIKNGATNAAAYTGVSGSNTTTTFPRHDGSAITGPWIKDNSITVATADLLWQDAEGLITNVGISIDGDYLTLTVGKDADTQEGNAVVAAKDGEGNIVWSWHIWVTKQTFATLTTVATGSHDYQVTPVNLGWVGAPVSQGYNTFYQWGRKDPFPGMGSVTYSTSSATIADHIKNPTTFYNVGGSSGMPSNTTYYNMWDAKQTGTDNIATATVKTVYDPSPAGFCVPTGNLYYYITNGSGVSSRWDSTNNGCNLTSVTPNVFFPASGYREYINGSLSDVGSKGYDWSASAYGSITGRARILRSDKWKWSYECQAYGYPVRAVAEE